MCAYRPGFRRSGKQSFPTPDYSNLPVNALVARYTLNLLPHSPWHSEFLELLFAYAGVSGVSKAILDTFGKVLPQDEVDRIRKTEDSDELTGTVIRLIEEQSSSRQDVTFRSNLAARCLKTRLPALPHSGQHSRCCRITRIFKQGSIDP
jgi:hypothetical protein